MTKEGMFSPAEIDLVTEILDKKLGIDFPELFGEFKNNSTLFELKDKKKPTADDLINTIVEDGNLQLDQGAAFEDVVIAGAQTIAASLGLK